MSHPESPLKITLVSPDSRVLLELSGLLSAVGYTVVSSKDVDENAAWRQFSETDVLLFDGRSIATPTQAILSHRSDRPLQRIFLYDPGATTDLAAWFVAGANDALIVPVSRGELLARIRTGARMIEFERRMRSQSSQSHLPGMYSQRGLIRKLNKLASAGKSAGPGHTLLSTKIDLFSGIGRQEGASAALGLVEALATAIQQSVGDETLAAYHDDGTFHVLLPGQDAASAHAVAEQIAEKFRAAQVDREPSARFTLSTAIVSWQVGTGAEQLLEQGKATLAVAAQSGGNCAIDPSAFAKEITSWQNDLTAGNPLAKVFARDIMEPFPALLQSDAPNPSMLAALRRSRVPVLPFVDREGRLVGIASAETESEVIADWQSNSGGSVALANPKTIEQSAPLSEISAAFSAPDCSAIVVVADRRPLGYLTLSGFVSLIKPITLVTYSSDESGVEDSRSLIVGSRVNDSELVSPSDRLQFHLPLREPFDRSALPASQ